MNNGFSVGFCRRWWALVSPGLVTILNCVSPPTTVLLCHKSTNKNMKTRIYKDFMSNRYYINFTWSFVIWRGFQKTLSVRKTKKSQRDSKEQELTLFVCSDISVNVNCNFLSIKDFLLPLFYSGKREVTNHYPRREETLRLNVRLIWKLKSNQTLTNCKN